LEYNRSESSTLSGTENSTENSDMASLPWFEHLTQGDRDLVARAAQEAGIGVERLRRDEDALAAALAHHATFRIVWGDGGDDALLRASPFLVFAVAVHRAWSDVGQARHIEEWVGARQRVPVLGASDLRVFLSDSQRRLFVTSLLASYTRVASGSMWVQTDRGWRRRRFSELDPVRLASLLDVVPEEEQPGIYRRLGDLALFLTGVFPDHTALHGFGPIAEGRLLRAGRLPAGAGALPPDAPGPVGLLEHLGQRWYKLACRATGTPLTGTMRVVAEVAEQFGLARRVLNFVTDRYLFPVRVRWFGGPPG
jgi:hypothetical protein